MLLTTKIDFPHYGIPSGEIIDCELSPCRLGAGLMVFSSFKEIWEKGVSFYSFCRNVEDFEEKFDYETPIVSDSGGENYDFRNLFPPEI